MESPCRSSAAAAPVEALAGTLVCGIEEAAGRREQMQAALQRYTAAMARQHHHDEIIDGSVPSDR